MCSMPSPRTKTIADPEIGNQEVDWKMYAVIALVIGILVVIAVPALVWAVEDRRKKN